MTAGSDIASLAAESAPHDDARGQWPRDIAHLHPSGAIDPIYRMPRIFGPSAGPRNVPAPMQRYRYVHDRTQLTVEALTDARFIERYLPPGCRLAGEPVIRVSASCLKRLAWLAGRGYNIITVQFLNIAFDGAQDSGLGSLDAVLWESLCDPIITGREEIAIPKIFADIPDPVMLGGTCSASASWEGFRFFDLNIGDLSDSTNPPPFGPRLAYKYFPKSGSLEDADVEYMTIARGDAKQPPVTLQRYAVGQGRFSFQPARWEDMPTQYHIVNALAEMPLTQMLAADLRVTSQGETDSVGGGSGSGQEILR